MKVRREREAESAGASEWLVREAGALLTVGLASFLFLALLVPEWTGTVGRLVARPLRTVFGFSSYLLPLGGFLAALQIVQRKPAWTPARWAAWLGVLQFGAILAEIAGVAAPRAVGGIYGEFLGNAVIRENFGSVGAWCLVLPPFVFCVLAVTATSFRDLGRRLAERGRAIRAAIGERRRRSREAPATRLVRSADEAPAREKATRRRDDRMIVIRSRRRDRAPARPAAKPSRQEAFSFAEDGYRHPPLNFLDEPPHDEIRVDEDALRAQGLVLENKLANFGIEGRVRDIHPGPVITTFEFEPAPGVKVAKIVSLADDLTMALQAMSVRILAPIPGKAVVGIEVSNPRRETVLFRDILESTEYESSPSRLPIALGKDSVGTPVVADLARMPHLLVAGATGTGKSVSLNAIIMSILFRSSPHDVRMLMIDPKMLELSLYENIPHLLAGVVTDPKSAVAALAHAVIEMEQRYALMREKGVRNIEGYNKAIEREAGKDSVRLTDAVDEAGDAGEGWTMGGAEGPRHRHLPYLVIVIDELADLMMTAGKKIEDYLTRLAQKARAAGIHLIVATQRPSVDVVTGLIKANFPARVSFKVTARHDSRTILDSMGAERLLGDGDMLYMPPGASNLRRIHGAYVSESEVAKVTGFLRELGRPTFDDAFVQAIENAGIDDADGLGLEGEEDDDPKWDDGLALLEKVSEISTSKLQRYLKIGYNRAARMIERMEREGFVGPSDGARPRPVLGRGEDGEPSI